MGMSIVVDQSSFETEVLQQSYKRPVLIDFFATWCGPCQMLKPILEKLVPEYDFVLAKVDIDQNPELANRYHIEGVPDVRVATQGQVNPGFVGVLPEPKIRDLLAQLGLKSDLETRLERIQMAQTAGEAAEVEQLYNDVLQAYPDNRELLLDAAQFYLSQGRLDQVETLTSSVQQHETPFYDRAQTLRAIAQFRQEVDNPVVETELDQLYLEAAQHVLEEKYEVALQRFLEIVSRDRKFRDDGGRKAMLTVFNLLGDDDPLVRDYRKKLMQTLY
jgi:putative thioredoxin